MAKKLVRIAIGASERALCDSKTAVNLWMTEQECRAISDVQKRMEKATRQDHQHSLPIIHLQVLETSE